MNTSRVISIPNGSTAMSMGTRVSLAIQNSTVVTVPAGTAASAIGTLVRDVAAGSAPAAGTVANGLGQYSTSDIFIVGMLSYGIADGAIALGAAVYGQTNGQITATATGTQIGTAIQQAFQAGDVIEFVSAPLI